MLAMISQKNIPKGSFFATPFITSRNDLNVPHQDNHPILVKIQFDVVFIYNHFFIPYPKWILLKSVKDFENGNVNILIKKY